MNKNIIWQLEFEQAQAIFDDMEAYLKGVEPELSKEEYDKVFDTVTDIKMLIERRIDESTIPENDNPTVEAYKDLAKDNI